MFTLLTFRNRTMKPFSSCGRQSSIYPGLPKIFHYRIFYLPFHNTSLWQSRTTTDNQELSSVLHIPATNDQKISLQCHPACLKQTQQYLLLIKLPEDQIRQHQYCTSSIIFTCCFLQSLHTNPPLILPKQICGVYVYCLALF